MQQKKLRNIYHTNSTTIAQADVSEYKNYCVYKKSVFPFYYLDWWVSIIVNFRYWSQLAIYDWSMSMKKLIWSAFSFYVCCLESIHHFKTAIWDRPSLSWLHNTRNLYVDSTTREIAWTTYFNLPSKAW